MVCYLKPETYSGPISFEVPRNDIWTDNIQSFEMPLGTRTGYCKPTQRGTDETPHRLCTVHFFLKDWKLLWKEENQKYVGAATIQGETNQARNY